MQGKYPVITLCGSTRFKDEFMEMQKKLTLEGNIVISVGLFGHSGDSEVWENMDEGTLTKTKEMLDDIHKRKIDMSDEIFVINVGGYIGDSTRSEIAYAIKYGKKVRYLEEEQGTGDKKMNIQIFGTKKCNDTKKAERFFKERGIKYQFIDMKEKGMSKGELTSVSGSNGGIMNMIDPDAKDKDAVALLQYIADEDKLEKLLENQQIIKTPVVRNGKQSTLGYQPDVWKKWE